MNTKQITSVIAEFGSGTECHLLTKSLALRDGWQQISVCLRTDNFCDNVRRIYLESTSHVGIVIRPETHIVKAWEMISGVTFNWQLALNAVPIGSYQCSLIVDDGVSRQRLLISLLVQSADMLSGYEPSYMAVRKGF